MKKTTFIKLSKICLVILFLSSCAYSPQQITINPVVQVAGENYGGSLPVAVIVEDARVNKVLGSRGGAYPETSIITVSNDVATAIKRAAISKLAAQGFGVNSSFGINNNDGVIFKILLDELTYDKPEDPLDKKIYLKALMRAEVTYREKTFTGRYKTKSQKVALVTPSAKKNEQIINELLSTTLERLFADPKLQSFIVER